MQPRAGADIEMSLVPSLLNAILRLDGEALVMHVGEKPYVVAPVGQVELASRPLNFDAVSGMVSQLLPTELQNALDEFGAVQYEFPYRAEFPYEHFSVVAARGGEDVWVEVRRRRVPDDDRVPEEFFATSAAVPENQFAISEPVSQPSIPDAVPEPGDAALALPSGHQLWPAPSETVEEVELLDVEDAAEWAAVETEPEAAAKADEIEVELEPEVDLIAAVEMPPLVIATPAPAVASAPASIAPPLAAVVTQRPAPLAPTSIEPEPVLRHVEPLVAAAPVSQPIEPRVEPESTIEPKIEPPIARTVEPPIVPAPKPVPVVVTPPPPAEVEAPAPLAAVTGYVRPAPSQPAVVVPMARSPIRPEPPAQPVAAATGLDRLLRIAAARAASALYLTSQAQPSIRVDGEIQALGGEPVLSPSDVESLLIDLMPERNREELRSGIATEWICDVEDVGRVRCMTFRDHRGAGGIFRMMPVQAISADQLGLSREIQALAAEPEGLVLVAGPRSSGKSTLVSAFVDLINRTRRDHVITIESEIKVVHEQRSSLVSQREVRGNAEEMLVVARGAIRENPDVLVFEELRTAEMVTIALEAAGSGHLVIGALPAHTTTAAVDRIIDLYPPEQRRRVQLQLAEHLRGAVAQVLVRKPAGGRVAAREVLFNTPAVAGVIAEGKTSQLPSAIEGGRKYGMVPLNDALVGFVQSGAVDSREAYRRAADRSGFLALLKRQGIDTSALERLA